MKQNIYDVIIIGSGIAGLLVGSKLSKKNKVIILEKNVEYNYKTWFTKTDAIVEAGLEDYITRNFKKYFLDSPLLDERKYIECDFSSINEVKLVEDLKNEILLNGGVIQNGVEFDDIVENKDNIVQITTTDNDRYFGRIIIDCSGYNSRLAKKHKIYNSSAYHTVYGEIYNARIKDSEVDMLSAYHDKIPLNFFELIPVSKDKIVTYTFNLSKNIQNYEILKEANKMNISRCLLSSELKNVEPIKVVKGVIPMGYIRKNSLNNVIFFGDAIHTALPFSGVGFSYILKHYPYIVKKVESALKNNKFKSKFLKDKYTNKEMLNRHFHSIITSVYLNMNIINFTTSLEIITTVPSELIEKLFFGGFDNKDAMLFIKHIFSKKNISKAFKIIPKKCYLSILKNVILIVYRCLIYNFKFLNSSIKVETKKNKKSVNKVSKIKKNA